MNDDLNMSSLQTKLKAARLRMLMSFPFFGKIILHLPFKEVTCLPTAGTDGRFIYYNKDFIESLNFDELLFVMAHEVLHVVYDHIKDHRRGSREPFRWNAAGDFVINDQLIEGKKIGSMPSRVNPETGKKEIIGLHDKQYKGMYTEQIYELLKDEGKFKTIDCHISFDENGNPVIHTADGETITVDDINGEIEKMDAEEEGAAKSKMKSIIIQAASSSKGSLNGFDDLKRNLDDFLNPKIDWREFLQETMSALVKKDFTFSRPSRKSWSCGCTLPGTADGTQIDSVFAIDVSGSMGDAIISDLLGEVKSIVEQYEDFNVHVLCFSTGVHAFSSYTSDNINDLTYYEAEGCGGTDFECIWSELKERDIVPDQLVVLTDGYPGGSWGDELYCDTVFIVTNDGPTAPFGTTIHYTP